ncbi:MAG: helix-turn-helix domain-containing protein [Woeseiaceae bacterium]
MTDDANNPNEAAPAESEPLGSWLSAAREEKGLGTAAVAEALRLDKDVVERLEAEQFDALGAVVFVRGHLRAVASHLGLDADEAIRRFHALAGVERDEVPELVVNYNSSTKRRSITPVLLFGGGVLSAIGLLAVVWWFWPENNPEVAAAEAPAPVQAVTDLPDEDNAARNALIAAREASRAASSGAVVAEGAPTATRRDDAATALAAVEDQTAQITTPQTSSNVESGLRLKFSDTCWFEVRDANDRRLAYGTATSGTDRLITGDRPFQVTLGVADAAAVTVDGKPYTIASTQRRGRSARLTIE